MPGYNCAETGALIMRFVCTVKQLPEGRWRAEAFHSSVGSIGVTADDRQQVLDKLRAEIRYRLEWCPCSGVGDDYVELQVVGAGSQEEGASG